MISTYILPLLLVTMAAIMKAVADTLAWHYDISIFSRLRDRDFWEVNTARKRNIRRIFSYPVDAWHTANSIQIICWVSMIAFCKHPEAIAWWASSLMWAAWFVFVFNLFWNKILLK